MIQRIQSLYLLISAIISGGLVFAFSLWTITGGYKVMITDEPIAMALFILSAILSIYTITKYKVRQTQFVLGRLNILINLALVALLVYKMMNPNLAVGEVIESQGIVMGFPLVSVILIALANRAIKKDEDLVRSADRLR